ncbi:MAG: PH domain-containing protein, partial [Candidatus Saccharibacteria bacterium]|nr:PH domain-containing protein [Candidatus Saccharibacteria bacterium]
LIMLLIPLIVVVLVFLFAGTLNGDKLIYLGLGGSAYLLFVNAIFLTVWIEQYLDVCIITTDRLVHIRQIGLFNRRVAELSMTRVQDVSAQMRGYLQSILQFGTVVVETAGGAPDFVIRNVSKPHVVANTILMIHDRTQTTPVYESVPQTSGIIQQTIEQHTPNVAPPHDYQRKHLQEDLLSQAFEAQEDDLEEEQKKQPVEPQVIQQSVPNRLPPKRQIVSEVEGELVEGQDISIDTI